MSDIFLLNFFRLIFWYEKLIFFIFVNDGLLLFFFLWWVLLLHLFFLSLEFPLFIVQKSEYFILQCLYFFLMISICFLSNTSIYFCKTQNQVLNNQNLSILNFNGILSLKLITAFLKILINILTLCYLLSSSSLISYNFFLHIR